MYQKMIRDYSTRISEDSLGQALLLAGEPSTESENFISDLLFLLSCQNIQHFKPCKTCQSCLMVASSTHPDIHFLIPDKPGGLIKIEQLRLLQEWIFLSPRMSKKRIIVINPADKMNPSAANALLKILEEPPPHIVFLLIASNIASVLPTILSRCRRCLLPYPENNRQEWLKKGSVLSESLEDLKRDFINLGRTFSALELAEKWSGYPLDDMVDFLYRMTAMLLVSRLSPADAQIGTFNQSRMFNLSVLFQQIDKLNQMRQLLNKGIAINQQLSLEAFLSGYE